MIALLLIVLLVVIIWLAVRTAFAGHPANVRLILDLVFLVIVIALIARWAGLLP